MNLPNAPIAHEGFPDKPGLEGDLLGSETRLTRLRDSRLWFLTLLANASH
jgi:hypothetical protein